MLALVDGRTCILRDNFISMNIVKLHGSEHPVRLASMSNLALVNISEYLKRERAQKTGGPQKAGVSSTTETKHPGIAGASDRLKARSG